jgi:hypothetical protein
MGFEHQQRRDEQRRESPAGRPVNLSVYVSLELRRAAKVHAAQHSTTVSALVARLLDEHLRREGAE